MSDWLLDLHDICRDFGPVQALKNVTLQLRPGRIGLLGPNGAGKSTLLKILMGLLPPTSGTGRVLNQPIGLHGGSNELRRLIGFMPEADALVPGMRGVDYVALAGELYGLPRRQAQRRAHEILTYLELEEARYRPVQDYSTGMKQRVKLAQAIVHDPPVLLLDEPTSGLDPAGRDAMLRLLLELGRDFGKSLLICTHLLADVEAVCEQVVIVYGGRIRGQGKVDDLCRRRNDRLCLRLSGDLTAFRDDLTAGNVAILHDNGRGELRVRLPPDYPRRDLFAIAANRNVVLQGLTRDDESLEEMFLRTIGTPDLPIRES